MRREDLKPTDTGRFVEFDLDGATLRGRVIGWTLKALIVRGEGGTVRKPAAVYEVAFDRAQFVEASPNLKQ